MKKMYRNILLLMGLFALTACQSDNGGQPTSTADSSTQEISQSSYISEEISSTINQISQELSESITDSSTDTSVPESSDSVDNAENQHSITINEEQYAIELYDNQTVNELMDYLPLNITMEDLNANEKFYYLDQNLTTISQNVGQISRGDIMLFGSNCLVLFYESFPTSYSYTPIGRIIDSDQLTSLREAGSVSVQLS